MRALLFTFAGLLAASTASASSIRSVTSGQEVNSSIAQLSCAHCPPLVVKKKVTYVVPEVANGTERVELKEINGEMKLVRTEAWLGGSPVVFISKASDDAIKAAQAEALPAQDLANATTAVSEPANAQATATLNVIDTAAKTSAVSTATMTDMAAITPQDSHSQEVDLETFQLRLK